MTDRRAVSTVVDVSLCLLLVSASVLALASATPPPAREESNDARRAAAVLGAGTARVEYRPPGPVPSDQENGNRTATGTLAGLLADAAIVEARGAAVDGPRPAGYVARTRTAVRRALGPVGGRVQVVAAWHPFDGSAIEGRVVVGDRPPAAATAVDAVTMTVPVGAADATARARRAFEKDGRPALARSLARSTAGVLFGPPRAGPDGRPPPRSAAAYHRFAATHDLAVSDTDGPLDRSAVIDALATHYRAELPEGSQAAAAVSPGTVTVVVRTWSP